MVSHYWGPIIWQAPGGREKSLSEQARWCPLRLQNRKMKILSNEQVIGGKRVILFLSLEDYVLELFWSNLHIKICWLYLENTKVSQILRKVPGLYWHSVNICQINEYWFQFIFKDKLSEELFSSLIKVIWKFLLMS